MKKILTIALLLVLQLSAKAQFLDSLQLVAGTQVSVASKDYLPFWLVSNRFGVISDQKFDFSTHVRVTNSHRFGSSTTIYDDNDNGFYVSYGADIYNNDHLKKNFVEQAYIKARFKNITFSGGRFEQLNGEVDPDLSSGSLGVSGNALPITKLNLAMVYTDIPFTNGWIQFKGLFSHGWMGPNQFMKHAFLHEKNLYFRLGKHKLKLYGGIQHYAVWGGSRTDFFKTGRSFSDFINVVTGIEANDGSVVDGSLPNRPGDHRGVIEFGGEWDGDRVKVQVNHQTPFDSGQGIDVRNQDRLLSLNITNKDEEGIWKKFVIEYINTLQMNNFYPNQVRDNDYNNGIYRTGWEYNDHVIGTPLFINRVRANKYYESIVPHDWDASVNTIPGADNIVANRLTGLNVGAMLALNEDISTKTKITYTKNYGNFLKTIFSPYKTQWYTMQEVSWHMPNTQLSLSATVAYDFGDLSSNLGTLIGLQWQLKR